MDSSTLSSKPTSAPTAWPPLFWWGSLASLALATLWMTPFPPMVDWPLQMAQGVLLAEQHNPAFFPKGVYCVQPFSPYHLFHYGVASLYKLVGPWWLSRVVLSVHFGLYISSLWSLLRQSGAEKRVLALAIPFYFGFLYHIGFGANFFGLPFFLFSLASVLWWIRHPNWGRGLLVSATLLFTWLCHPLPFYYALLGGGCLVLFGQWGSWRKLGAAVLWLSLPSLIAAGYLLSLSKAAQGTRQLRVVSVSFWQRLQELPAHLYGISHQATLDTSLALSLLVILLALGLMALGSKERATSTQKQRLWWGLGFTLLVGLVLYLVVPFQLLAAFYVYHRFALPMALLSFALIAPVHQTRRLLLLRCGWLIASLMLLWNALLHWQWRQQTSDLMALLPKVPRGAKVMYLVPNWGEQRLRKHAMLYQPAWGQVLHGGEYRFSFSFYRRMPVVDCRPNAQKRTAALIAYPAAFRPQRHGHHAPYLLLHTAADLRRNQQFYPWLFQRVKYYKALEQRGRWLLLQRLHTPASRPTKQH